MLALLLCLAAADIEVSLEAEWKKPSAKSLIQETSEFYAEFGKFWEFIDALPEIYEVEGMKPLIELALANRDYALMLETYAGLAKDLNSKCGIFYVTGDKVFCDISELEQADFQEVEVYEFDKVLNQEYNIGFIAYEDITDSEFSQRHARLKELAERKKAAYVLRHVDVREEEHGDLLGGYGAELVYKNLEYNTYGDTVDIDFNPNFEGQSINTAFAVREMLQKRDFEGMIEFLDNWPSYISTIPQASQEFIQEISNRFYVMGMVEPNLLQINSHPLESNISDILTTVRRELLLYNSLKQLGIEEQKILPTITSSNEHLHQYYHEPDTIKTSQDTGRFYLNDLAKDKAYANWSKNEMKFIRSEANAKFAFNFFNLIAVLDIDTVLGWSGLRFIVEVYYQQLPVRVGVILQGNSSRVGELYGILAMLRRENERMPLMFLSLLQQDYSQDDLKEALEYACPHCSIPEPLVEQAAKSKEFCDVIGMCGPAEFMLNGKLIPIDQDDLDDGKAFEKIQDQIEKQRRMIKIQMVYNNAKLNDEFFEKGTNERQNAEITDIEFSELKIVDQLSTQLM